MYPLKVVSIGKIKNKNLVCEIDDLSKRINRLEFIFLKDVKDNNIENIKKKEYDLIKTHISSENFNILLWEHGKDMNTNEFYKKIKKVEKPVVFIITGAFGPGEELKNCVDMTLSLSKMTFTHEQAMYMLVEQLYRAQCFEKGIDYNK